jgi:hypothetical protein
MTTIALGEVDAGTEAYIEAVFRATSEAPTAASTAVTFSLAQPDGRVLSKTDADPEVTGPTAGTEVVDGVTLTTTRWVYKTPALALVGRYTVEAQSTAGMLVTKRGRLEVPTFAPFTTP